MCHYLSYTSAWVTGNTAETAERERPGGEVEGWRGAAAASINTHHANSTVIYGESSQSRGTSDLHTQLSEEDISGQGFQYRIPLRLQDALAGSLCCVRVQVCVCAGVCVCLLLSQTDIELYLAADGHRWLRSTRPVFMGTPDQVAPAATTNKNTKKNGPANVLLQ